MPPKAKKATAKAASGGDKKRSASKSGGASTKKKGSTAAPTDSKGEKEKKPVVAEEPTAPPPEVVDGRDLWMATDALQKTKAMRNYFQLERDRILSFWDITKKELEDTQDRLREKEQIKVENEERHEVELKVFKTKIRHLLFENQMHLSTLKEEAERTLKSKENEYRALERIAREQLRGAKVVDRETEVRQLEQQRALVTQQDKEIAEQQAQFEREIKEIHSTYENKLKTLREEMDRARREEMDRMEKNKLRHANELREMHERTFKEMKDYFGEITSNNLETIRTLKDEVYARKRTETHNQKAMYEVALRNKKLTEPLAKAQKQKKDLETELEDFDLQKEKLRQLKETTREAEQEYQDLSWEHEVLTQRYAKLVEDRDIILKKYNTMLQDIQKKSAFRRVLLQKKLELVRNELEGRDAKLTELLKQADIDASDMKELEHKVHDLISEKDYTIENLKVLLVRLTERNEDIVNSYEEYLSNNGVSGLNGTTTTTKGMNTTF